MLIKTGYYCLHILFIEIFIGCHGNDHMFWVWFPPMVVWTWYNFMWSNLLVTWGRLVVFSLSPVSSDNINALLLTVFSTPITLSLKLCICDLYFLFVLHTKTTINLLITHIFNGHVMVEMFRHGPLPVQPSMLFFDNSTFCHLLLFIIKLYVFYFTYMCMCAVIAVLWCFNSIIIMHVG